MTFLEPQFTPSGPNNHPFKLRGTDFAQPTVFTQSHNNNNATINSQQPPSQAPLSICSNNTDKHSFQYHPYAFSSNAGRRASPYYTSASSDSDSSSGSSSSNGRKRKSMFVTTSTSPSSPTSSSDSGADVRRNKRKAMRRGNFMEDYPTPNSQPSPTELDKPVASSASASPKSSPSQQRFKFHMVHAKESGQRHKKGTWTNEEHEAFLKGYELYGNDWKRISQELVPTRSKTQLASHAQKYFQRAAYLRQLGETEKQETMSKSRSLFFLKSHLE
jgi:SHAQKYF class myb-like DNA-binding protein